MATHQFSLMTFCMTKELVRKTMTIQDTLQLAANAGLRYVDLRWVGTKKLGEYLSAIRATGVKVCCYISVVSFFGKERAISAALDREMRIAQDLGASLFMIIPYKQFFDCRKAKKLGRLRVLEQMVKGFQLAMEKGKEYGLTVCFETTPEDVICLSGTEDCRYVLDHVPGLGLVFDTANMLPHGDDTLSAYEALKDRIVHVHLKDVELLDAKPSLFENEVAADGRLMRGTVYGKGVIPVKEVFDRMVADGYHGVFAIEYVRPKSEECTLQEHESYLKPYLNHLVK